MLDIYPPSQRRKRCSMPVSMMSIRIVVIFGIASFVSCVYYALFVAPSPYAVARGYYYQNRVENRNQNIRRLNAGDGSEGYASLEEIGYNWKPRVVGVYAYDFSNVSPEPHSNSEEEDNTDDGENVVPNALHIEYSSPATNDRSRSNYVLLTERIDPYLLSYTSQTLRRIRIHDHPSVHSHSEMHANYISAIANSNADVYSEDPLTQLMLSSESRSKLRDIRENSQDYKDEMAEPLKDEKCDADPQNAKWMTRSFPTCNMLHELNMPHSLEVGKSKILGNGFWRDVWRVLDLVPPSPSFANTKQDVRNNAIVLKTIRYKHKYTEYNFDRHRRDALASERLTSSPRVVDMFAFCGQSGFFEYSSGGSLEDRIQEHLMAIMDEENRKQLGRNDGDDVENSNYARPLSQYDKLHLAYQVAAALADAHDADALRDANGKIISAAIVHADITPGQFIEFGGVYKLNDFNRCRFMRWYHNSTNDVVNGYYGKPCGFRVGFNPSRYRSPEEYAYDEETEKIDIYSVGNIFYTLLTDLEPWADYSEKKAQKRVLDGKRPKVPEEKKQSVDFVDVALRQAMYGCWLTDPKERPRARKIADYLSSKLQKLRVNDAK